MSMNISNNIFINYRAIKLKTDDTKEGTVDLNSEGLSDESAKFIDKNNDGLITEQEYKNAYGGVGDEYKVSLENLQALYLSKINTMKENGETLNSVVDKSGNMTGYNIVEDKNGRIVTTNYDNKGNKLGYTIAVTENGITTTDSYNASGQLKGKTETEDRNGVLFNTLYDNKGNKTGCTEVVMDEKNGITTTKKYDIENGKTVFKTTTVTYPNGSVKTVDEVNKITTNTVDGTSVSKNSNNQITKIKGSNGNQISLKYDDSGKVKSAKVTINGKEFSGSKVEYLNDNQTIVIKDKSGNSVAKIQKDEDGKTYVTSYNSNGKKSQLVTINSKGVPSCERNYNEKGKLTEKRFCASGTKRTYKYDGNGNILSSTDTNAEGRITTKQTYIIGAASDYYRNRTGSLWATRTFYDADGNVSKYQEMEYDKNDNAGKEVTKTIISYTNKSKTETINTTEMIQDSFGNTKKFVQKIPNADGSVKTVTRLFEYNSAFNNRLLDKFNYKTIKEDSGNEQIVYTYEDGLIQRKSVSTINSGVTTTKEYEYEYYENSNGIRKALSKKFSNGTSSKIEYSLDGNQIVYSYNSDGSYTKTYTDENGQKVIISYDKYGNIV